MDKLGEHKRGGFCSQRPDMETVNDVVGQEDLVVAKNVDWKEKEDSVLAKKGKKSVPEDGIDGQWKAVILVRQLFRAQFEDFKFNITTATLVEGRAVAKGHSWDVRTRRKFFPPF